MPPGLARKLDAAPPTADADAAARRAARDEDTDDLDALLYPSGSKADEDSVVGIVRRHSVDYMQHCRSLGVAEPADGMPLGCFGKLCAPLPLRPSPP